MADQHLLHFSLDRDLARVAVGANLISQGVKASTPPSYLTVPPATNNSIKCQICNKGNSLQEPVPTMVTSPMLPDPSSTPTTTTIQSMTHGALTQEYPTI